MAVARRAKQQKDAVDDLVLLDNISEGGIVTALQNRYGQDLIYTNIASVLIAINPFKMIASNYTDAKVREYHGKKHYECAPHVFALADEAYSNMISYRENQCVIISGESGSGKTETSKFIMQYISGVSGKSVEVVRVKDCLLNSNPILEGFGNAKTINNNNSSRFGKYLEILFDLGGDPVGGRVTNYLLEKSRVVGPSQTERNFHVFYQLCAGATQQERQTYCIENAEYFYYLSCSGCYSVPGINDVEDWKEMNQSFHCLGINETERQEVIRSLSICLWLGNLAFCEKRHEIAEVQDRQVLDIIAGLLQVPSASLENALCNRQIQTGIGAKAEKFTKPQTSAQADFSRDTLAKAIFSKLFDWLVAKINVSIKKDNFQGIQIGVLDIYGFEIFQYNSFEQLCINFVNEKLQQIFIELTLKAEQDEYAQEGIPWKDIPYTNNKPLCDLIEGKPGLLSIGDDCCNTSKTDAMFVMDLKSYFSGNNNIICGQNDFSVRHYAGDVRYQSENFLTKNKDQLFDDLILVMQQSPCQFVRDHGWRAIEVSEGQKKKPPTVGAVFRTQVQTLMTALKACQPHYIRCIKPNNTKKPNEFDKDNVTRQVKYLGLLENVRVRRAGYAHRATFERFLKRYAMLSKTIWSGKGRGSPRDFCTTVAQDLGWQLNKEYALGKTKVFIQEATTLFALEDALERRMDDAIVVIQKAYRNYRNKRYFLTVRSDAYELVNGRKERRRGSVSTRYQGDYISALSNKLIHGLLSMNGSREKLLFADRCKHEILKGKRSVLGSIFGKKETEFDQPRIVVLTDKALYSFIIDLDPVTFQSKISLYFRVPILQISHVVVSPYCDNWVAIHFSAIGFGGIVPTDVFWRIRHKTELLALLAQESKKLGRNMFDLRFQPQDLIVVNAQKQKQVEIKWVKDDMLDSCTDRLDRIKHNLEIHVASGIPANQVPVPTKPTALDASSPGSGRPSLKALYDCAGNEAQGELAFKTGDIIFIIKDEEGGWFEGELHGKRGFVPGTYVERIKRAVVNNAKPTVGARPGATGGAVKAGGKPMFNFGASTSSSASSSTSFAPPPPVVVPAKKSNWTEEKTDSGEIYYFNSVTQESVWDKPADFAPPTPQVMSPVSTTIAKDCAFNGCSKPRFGGKPYCVQHASQSNTPATTSTPSSYGGSSTNSTPSYGGASSNTTSSVASRFGGGASSTNNAAPVTSSYSSSTSNSTPAPRFGGGGLPAARPVPATNANANSNGAPTLAARPAARFGGQVNTVTGPPAVATSNASSSGAPAKRASFSSGNIQSAASNLFKGGVPMFGAPRPIQVNSNAAGAYSAPQQAQPQPQRVVPVSVAAPPPPVRPVVPAKKKSDWSAVVDPSSGDTYYWNEKTNESSWDKPADL